MGVNIKTNINTMWLLHREFTGFEVVVVIRSWRYMPLFYRMLLGSKRTTLLALPGGWRKLCWLLSASRISTTVVKGPMVFLRPGNTNI